MQPLLQLENVRFHYPAEEDTVPEEVVKGVSLTVNRGELVAVLGHNGSGKSTLAKMCNGILLPTEGRVLVDGMDTAHEERLQEIRRRVGMVFQNPDNQIVATIVEEDVAFALENMGVPQPEMRQRVDEALKAVHMYDYRNHAPHQLSGGQKQRVAIAGIIAMRPECIVMDEPTAMLDPHGRGQVMRTIRKLNREFGITVLLITHEMDEAAQCDRVVVVEHGTIRMDDTPRNVFARVAEMKEIGLDVPQVTELAELLRQGGYPLDSHIITEEECVAALYQLLKGRETIGADS